MDFEKVKELLKEAIDEGNTIAEIMQITVEKIYQQGVKDGESERKRKKWQLNMKNQNTEYKWIHLNEDKDGFTSIFECPKCYSTIHRKSWMRDNEWTFCPICGNKNNKAIYPDVKNNAQN